MVRYLQTSAATFAYAIEGTAYSKESTVDQYFGLLREDIEPPNPNPVTPMATGNERRGPHVNSPDPKEYSWDIPFQPIDEKAPFEIALGKRTTTATVDPDSSAGSGDEYQKDLIEEQNRLPTATIGHWQEDDSTTLLEAYYVGCKAGLSMTASQGEPLQCTLSPVAAELDATTAQSGSPSSPPSVSVPQETPYRFWMVGDLDIDLASDDSDVTTIGTVHSIDFTWDPGLEANHHGDTREAYSVSEENAEEVYDMTVGVTITDMQLYDRAYNDDAPVNVEVVFNKDPTDTASRSDYRDALYVRLDGCTITDAPSPIPGQGKLEADIALAPRDTEIEIHTPV